MSLNNIGKSFFHALHGIKITLKTQKHIHLHIFIFLLLIYVIIFGGVGLEDALILAGISIMVIMAEMINTAIELLCDYVTTKHQEFIGMVKDVAAGTVLMATLAAIIMGYIILADPLIVSIIKFKYLLDKIPLLVIFVLLFLFGLLIIIYNRLTYNKYKFSFSGLSFGISFLVCWLLFEAFSITFIFMLVVGGIILIEAILQNSKSDRVYLSGIWGILWGLFIYKLFHIEINIALNLAISSLLIGACPVLGSAFIANLGFPSTSVGLAVAGELVFLTFILIWGNRFKSHFSSNNYSIWVNRKNPLLLLTILICSSLPLPLSGAIAGSVVAIAFEVNKKTAWIIIFIGIIIKMTLTYFSLPLYHRLGG
ncbi:MAG: hypothetical protein APR63_06790 [Desulfuromonas sp. SDB]|nr:MAG: hypothetical protein APR63_06790 [Desulfuromonas sp. SDB]